MDGREFSLLVSKILERNTKSIGRSAGADPQSVTFKALGNSIHAYIGDQEFKIVVRTTGLERRWLKQDE